MSCNNAKILEDYAAEIESALAFLTRKKIDDKNVIAAISILSQLIKYKTDGYDGLQVWDSKVWDKEKWYSGIYCAGIEDMTEEDVTG